MRRIVALAVAALLVLLGLSSVFVVNEGQSALLLQFGRIVRADYAPGLHFKLPVIQQVLHFDKRILSLDAQPERYFTSEKKSVNVDFYVKWRIADNAAYYRATGGDQLQAAQRLTPIIKDALRFEFNARTLQDLISGGRKDITERVRQQTDASARKNLGIGVVDVRIKRIDLPDEVSESVYKRMRAERLQLANELRFTGQEVAEKIKADADRQGQVLRADAGRDAAKVRGEGDAQAAAIYAQAYSQDPDFFAFYRSLAAYRKSFEDGKGVLILKPDSEFLRYFGNPEQGRH
ncbi:MAG: HflC protein [Rhodanobacter sp. 68-29]|uniref:protease modulator HflC n=1 Tax=Rhodanobacter sp. PCA2 TaxID=2006117 RepID=UPI00086F77E5|nr:protease modulator HflC [Rhodanobacter sp. PCA2]MBA2078107.1 HflC protein [Rhodanobacter sp. PCA2]MBN8923176.1 protease modulator HflC [Rhodanobacter sp.]ODU73724.1 MAG: HflC protein [Rhodanobacter sp. SCN 69-32]OJY59458.1 MAG: HflC protein [Rhodanobacter sp. 68-29]